MKSITKASLKLNQKLTLQEVKRLFPGAIDALKEDYQFFFDDDKDAFIDQFEVDNVDALVEEGLEYYVVSNPCYSNVKGRFTVSFTEPNLGTNVSSHWIGEEWES